MEKLFKMFKNNISSVNNKTIQMIKEAVKEIKNLIYDNGFQENIINKHLCNIKQLVSIIPETPIKNIDRSFIEISGNFNKAPCKKKIEETVILIAEDSPTFLEILKDIVSSSGYKVKIAQNGKYAYQILKNEKIDLVISDIQMQEMNGFDLAYNIKNDPELMNIPIIFISSIETDKDAERGISTGADIYITKSSFEKNLLMDIIKKFV
jgi:two-component system chemotaxis sensor kinase CheA